ncbi:MAG: SOS response-associated peptidase [Clostridia bacterium]|nr:SOS response-associated peptidase [Clostridia bacterium]
MCGRYTAEEDTSIDMRALYRELRMSYPEVQLKSGEIYPTETVPLLCGRDKTPVPGTWGFPKYDGKGVIINARAESVQEKVSFRDAFYHRRCLVPTTGYFEWSRQKVKYRFGLPDAPMFCLAGLWTHTNEGLRFVILTTDANASVLPVHHRMPLVLTGEMTDAWVHSAQDAARCLGVSPPMLVRQECC